MEKAISRLLDKQLIESMGTVGKSRYAFRATLLGRAAAKGRLLLPKYETSEDSEGKNPPDGERESSGA